MLREIRPIIYTVSINGNAMKLRYDMNALDYLERVYGGLAEAFADQTVLGQKQVIRAALLCNYPENLRLLEENRLDDLRPALSEVGGWFDMPGMEALSAELYRIALEQMNAGGEGKQGLGEPETLVNAIGALCRLYGRRNCEEALRAFGEAHPAKS